MTDLRKNPETIPAAVGLPETARGNGAAMTSAVRQSDALIVAQLGRRALTETDVTVILHDTSTVVADRLGTEFVKVLELVPSGEGFLLTAGVGWKPGYVGQVVVPLVPESYAGYTMLQSQPVVVEDLRTETRFQGMPLLHEHGIVSGISAVLRGHDRTHGIITAHSQQSRTFSEEDTEFLESVASVIAAVFDRRHTERALVDTHERLSLAMEAGRMGTWEWLVPTNEVIWSESLERIHGLEPGTFAGDFEAYSRDIHPDDRERVFNTIQQSVNEGHHELEYRIVLPDGSVRWLAARGNLIRDPRGAPLRMLGICTDMTERKEAETRNVFLARASAILSTSLDYETTLASVAELCVPDLGDWCTIDVLENEKLNRVAVVHMDPAKVEMARSFQERYPPDTENNPDMQSVLREGQSLFYPAISEEVIEESMKDRDEEYKTIVREMGLRSAIVVPLKARGRTLGVLTLVHSDESGRNYKETDVRLAEDLAHRAALAVDNAGLYTESQRIQEELRVANEAKDEFLGLVSHELRTPITTIYGGARLLRARGANLDADSQREVIEDIEYEAERLHRIVEDLLVLARVELGQEVITEPILIQRVAEKTVTALSKSKPGRHIALNLPDDLPTVRASGIYLEQVLRNLVNNSDKYSPAEHTIELEARADDEEVVVSVMDRGPGLPSEELDLIFERFYRSSGTAKQAGGAGIGLTVCKRLLEAQNGRIWAESRPDGGLVVSFSLPLYREDRPGSS